MRLKQDKPEHYKLYQSLQKSHGRPAPFYGLVKTHKLPSPPINEAERKECVERIKLRPIAPSYRSIDAPLCKFLTSILQQLPKPPHSISSPNQVLQLLRDHSSQAPDCKLASLDVVAMFPSISTELAMETARKLLEQHKTGLSLPLSTTQISSLLEWSLKNTHLVVNFSGTEKYFQQKKGLAMGKSFSPVLADLVMGEWERDLEAMAKNCGCRIHFFCRYADDFLIAYTGEENTFDQLVLSLNRKDPSIQVTAEKEDAQCLPFLDLLIHRGQDSFETKVFRKNCNTGQIIPWSSSCEPQHKWGALNAEVLRAKAYCSRRSWLRREISEIQAKFCADGYPPGSVQRRIQRLLQAGGPRPTKPDPKLYVSIPYNAALPQLKKAAKKIGILFASKPCRTINSMLCSQSKHRLRKEHCSGVVYSIPCSCGSEYVGETGGELKDRIGQHRSKMRTQSSDSAFWNHNQGLCTPQWEATRILCQENKNHKRLIKEAIHIQKAGPSLIPVPPTAAVNRNAGKTLDPALASLL